MEKNAQSGGGGGGVLSWLDPSKAVSTVSSGLNLASQLLQLGLFGLGLAAFGGIATAGLLLSAWKMPTTPSKSRVRSHLSKETLIRELRSQAAKLRRRVASQELDQLRRQKEQLESVMALERSPTSASQALSALTEEAETMKQPVDVKNVLQALSSLDEEEYGEPAAGASPYDIKLTVL